MIEPDPELRRLDNEALEPSHPLVARLMGLRKDDRFDDHMRRPGRIVRIRHKYVARLHHILENYQARFPEINGFRRIDADPADPACLEGVKRELEERKAWFDEEHAAYQAGPQMLSVLASRLGLDTIEAAGSLVAAGRTIKVSRGSEQERAAGFAALRSSRGRGCVLDLITFWTAWEIGAINAVAAACGTIHLPQAVLDRLHARRERMAPAATEGLRSAALREGRIVLEEATQELVQTWLSSIGGALSWIERHAMIEPALISANLNDELRRSLAAGAGDVVDSLVVAQRLDLLLVSDDGPMREIGVASGVTRSASLHQALTAAQAWGLTSFDEWIHHSAALIERGHDYVGINAMALVRAAILDTEAGTFPKPLYQTLILTLGGQGADPSTHATVAHACLAAVWREPRMRDVREKATSMLLRRLLCDRPDRLMMFEAILEAAWELPGLRSYLADWSRGHFLTSC